MIRRANAERVRRAGVRPLAGAFGAALLGLFLGLALACSPVTAQGQRGGGRGAHFARPAGRANAPRSQGERPGRQQQQPYRRQPYAGGQPHANGRQQQPYQRQENRRPGKSGPATELRPAWTEPYERLRPRPELRAAAEFRQAALRPARLPGRARLRVPRAAVGRPYSYPGAYPPGHLGSWLNQHQNVPLQGQEQLLRNDPSFRRLPQGDQQRLMHQLQQVDRMPQQERERRLARAEIIEHMSPQQRMELNQSSRQLQALPAGRQQLVKRAFQDLSSVPLDQRQTVLGSERYQEMFSPQERNILGSLLQAEPY